MLLFAPDFMRTRTLDSRSFLSNEYRIKYLLAKDGLSEPQTRGVSAATMPSLAIATDDGEALLVRTIQQPCQQAPLGR